MKCDQHTGTGECESLVLERLRYFTGRHMTARDFSDADAYHRTMRHLHNRILHGWGIACGLEVTAHERPECGVVIRCGVAIDCCGREVIVPKTVCQRIAWDAWPKSAGSDKADPDYVLLLCLEYREVLTEKVPVLYSKEACSGAAYEDGRIRETHALCWRAVKRDDLKHYGWHTALGCPPEDANDPCKQSEPCRDDTQRCCLDPECPPCHCVALAYVDGDEQKPEIATDGRRSIPQAREHLTHICWTSWPHGGLVKVSDFKDLRVRFDRPLEDPQLTLQSRQAGSRGISERTFVVQYGQQHEDLDFVLFHAPPHLMADHRTARYEVKHHDRDDYVNNTIHVTLRCDFLLDCQGNAVDGNHLGGRLPSGDGVVGGTFESWFRLVDDETYERMVQNGTAAGAQS
jgi:hypothetical protein